MNYPPTLRSLLGRFPFGLHIDGRAKLSVLRLLDLLFGPDGPHTLELPHGTLRVDTNQPNERLLYYAPYNLLRRARNSALFFVMRRVFRHRQGTFVDVGANLGLYSYLARTRGARTLLFEPEPQHYRFLQRNRRTFGPVSSYALSDTRTTVDLYVGDVQHSGASSLVMSEAGWETAPYEATVQVQALPFHAFLEEHAEAHDVDPSDIALIKIDVEGHEASVVRGMRGYLARADAAPIWCEVRGPASDRGAASYADVTRLAAEYGYQPFVFDGQDVRPFRPQGPPPQVFDLLLLVPERHDFFR